jgi:hypothetical protein
VRDGPLAGGPPSPAQQHGRLVSIGPEAASRPLRAAIGGAGERHPGGPCERGMRNRRGWGARGPVGLGGVSAGPALHPCVGLTSVPPRRLSSASSALWWCPHSPSGARDCPRPCRAVSRALWHFPGLSRSLFTAGLSRWPGARHTCRPLRTLGLQGRLAHFSRYAVQLPLGLASTRLPPSWPCLGLHLS